MGPSGGEGKINRHIERVLVHAWHRYDRADPWQNIVVPLRRAVLIVESEVRNDKDPGDLKPLLIRPEGEDRSETDVGPPGYSRQSCKEGLIKVGEMEFGRL